jgi:hypothetical protein
VGGAVGGVVYRVLAEEGVAEVATPSRRVA